MQIVHIGLEIELPIFLSAYLNQAVRVRKVYCLDYKKKKKEVLLQVWQYLATNLC